MNNHQIPAKAIEAAARVILAEQKDWLKWDDLTPFGKQCWLDKARAALEAAAPYMLAGAFEQGQKSGMRHADRLVAAAKIGKPELPGPISPNPYMRDTEGEK